MFFHLVSLEVVGQANRASLLTTHDIALLGKKPDLVAALDQLIQKGITEFLPILERERERDAPAAGQDQIPSLHGQSRADAPRESVEHHEL